MDMDSLFYKKVILSTGTIYIHFCKRFGICGSPHISTSEVCATICILHLAYGTIRVKAVLIEYERDGSK